MAPGRIPHWLLAALAAVALLACQDPAAKIAEHQKRGESYLEEQQYPEAILEFRNVLQEDPNHPGAHWGLARALLAQKDLRKAYWELQEAVRLDPSNLEAKLQYGQFLLFGKQEDLDSAVTTADEILATEPGSAPAWVLKARALDALDRNDEALEAYQKAVEAAPEQGGPLLLLANFHRQQGRNEEAEPLFRKLTEVEPKLAAYAAYGGYLASLGGRDDEAEAAYRKGLELAEPKERGDAYSLLANFLFRAGRVEQAEAVMREGIEKAEDPLPLIYGLARFYNARGDTRRAEEMIEEATRAREGDPEPLLLLSTYRGRNGDLEGALAAAEQAAQVAPDDLRARLRKAEVLVDLGYRTQDQTKIAQGRAIVDAVLGQDEASPEALFVKAKIELAERHLDEALAALRRALDTRPDWAQAHFLLGSIQFVQGDRTAARAELSRALELDAGLVEAHRLLARVHAALGDHRLAVETGREVLQQQPDDAEMRVLVAQSLVRLRRLDEALAELAKIPEAKRGAEEHYALGRVHMLQGDHDAARRELQAAAEAAPNRYEILRSLLDLDMRDGDIQDSVARIEEALRAVPEDAQLVQLHGEVSLYTGRTREAEAAFRRAIDLNPNDLRAYQSLARYLAVTGRPDEVVRTYERALDNNRESATLHLIVGSLYELQGRQDEAVERYEDAIRLDPGLAVAKNNLAYLLAERGGNLDRALDLAQEAKSLLPDNPNTADTLGWVLYKKRVPSAAIGYLREAEGGMPPDDPNLGLVRHHLALAYEADGQPARAREVLERAIKDLEARYGAAAAGEGGEAPPEPPWAAEVRSMHARLKDAAS